MYFFVLILKPTQYCLLFVHILCQSAEDDRSAVSNGQLWSSVFRCCGPVYL